MTNWKVHTGWLILTAVALFASWLVFHSWIGEHDARLKAEVQVADSQKRIEDLQSQLKSVNDAAEKQVKVLQEKQKSVKTPEQVVAALPEVVDFSKFPLNVRPILGNTIDVAVAAKPMYDALNECRQQAVEYGACQAREKIKDGIIEEKDAQNKALAKKPGFWKRLGSTLKTVAITAATIEAIRMAGGKP